MTENPSPNKVIRTTITAVVLMLVIPVTIVSQFTFGKPGSQILRLVYFWTWGLGLLAVIVLEALVFWRLFKITFLKALEMAILLKPASFIGYLMLLIVPFMLISGDFRWAIGGTTCLILMALFAWFATKKLTEAPVWVTIVIFACIALDGVFTPVLMSYRPDTISMAGVYLAIIVALGGGTFALTLVIEGTLLTYYLKARNLWKGVVVANLVSFVFLVLVGCHFAAEYSVYGSRTAAYGSRAKGTLRSIGSAQLAYQSGNWKQVYGSFQALQDVEDIAQGYTLGNMIENYSVTWEVNKVSVDPSEHFPTGITISTFTIIAWPDRRGDPRLKTFAITDDQVVRVWRPENRTSTIANPKTWDPIL